MYQWVCKLFGGAINLKEVGQIDLRVQCEDVEHKVHDWSIHEAALSHDVASKIGGSRTASAAILEGCGPAQHNIYIAGRILIVGAPLHVQTAMSILTCNGQQVVLCESCIACRCV